MSGRLECLQHFPRDGWTHRGATCMQFHYGFNDLCRWRFFQQVTGGAGPDSCKYFFIIFKYGEHQDLYLFVGVFDCSNALDATDIRQVRSEERRVGKECRYWWAS